MMPIGLLLLFQLHRF